ncbi:ABC-F family ATP-binding cassette domain-containing protein [uncultured Clostridium sp.]|uniref:ABC-F family ATP-binding cassette domain-containing protein n=1 Tax=uncultured Clostridium sp. TaxID=59620 RepID=UPI00261A4F36|nr:ABC-F family ATP-binding cassette domain-containing protein [uncultured Clostridium sp.]
MNLITLENISKSFSERILLDKISIGINDTDKIGIIGVNGAGKSTFLKIVAGVEEVDAGTVVKGNRVRIEYLSQNPDYDENATVIEQVFKGNSPEMKVLREYQSVLDELEKNYDDEKVHTKLIDIQVKVDALNLWGIEAEAKMVLTKLGVNDFSAKVSTLSGGQRKRIALSSALITPCELLILDEPTNHLDNATISWLEEYLNARKGALLMITHDRYFLDRVTNRILEVDRGRVFSYDGNYSIFLEKKMERVDRERTVESKRQSLLKKELAWVRKGAKARTTKQKARIQRYDDLASQENFKEYENVEISVMGTRLGKKILEFHGISKSFDDRELIKDFNYIAVKQDRIGIVGENGMGKSTLIKMINEEMLPDTGEIIKGETVNIGYFSQDSDEMNPNMRAIDYIREVAEFISTEDGTKISAGEMCERFLFDGTMQYTLIEKLSGGERRRLQLLRVLMGGPNVLLFDEPTNDLDIETLQILEDYLDGFGGVVMVVSHDRYFLDRVCRKVFAYEGNAVIREYTGNYSDYLICKEIEDLNKKEEIILKEKKDSKKDSKKTKFSYKEQKEYDEIEADIAKIEEKIESLDNQMATSVSEYSKLQDMMKLKSEAEKQLEVKYERWEYLNDLAAKIDKNKKN